MVRLRVEIKHGGRVKEKVEVSANVLAEVKVKVARGPRASVRAR